MDLNYYLATPLDKQSGRPSPSWERLTKENTEGKGESLSYFYGVNRLIIRVVIRAVSNQDYQKYYDMNF